MSNYVVYKHTSPSGKVYIGMTKQLAEKRWQYGLGYRTQPKFYRAIQKYGWENIQHEVMFSDLSFEEAEQKERELIERYHSCDNRFGYNVERGGNAQKGMSEETRNKLRKANTTPESLTRLAKQNRQRWSNPEEHTKASERVLGSNNPMYGRKIPESQRQAMIEGIRRSEKVRNRFGEKNSFYGKRHTDETKSKISTTRTGAKNWRAQKVLCVETEDVYPCVKDAWRETGIHFSNISKVCLGKAVTAGGYHWKYID